MFLTENVIIKNNSNTDLKNKKMKTKIEELQLNIINITTKIQDKFPELSKFITEMPENNSENEAVNIKNLEGYYLSLVSILKEYTKTHEAIIPEKKSKSQHFSDLQNYPPSEDIYQQFKEEKDINPEDLSKKKSPNEKEGWPNEKNFNDDMSGSDLDVPGSELDDLQESVGSEDEENNYYSLGGDNHNDLEEDKG